MLCACIHTLPSPSSFKTFPSLVLSMRVISVWTTVQYLLSPQSSVLLSPLPPILHPVCFGMNIELSVLAASCKPSLERQ